MRPPRRPVHDPAMSMLRAFAPKCLFVLLAGLWLVGCTSTQKAGIVVRVAPRPSTCVVHGIAAMLPAADALGLWD